MSGQLFFGDNLHVLRQHVRSESIDLIYLDPPFNSNASYNILFRGPSGTDAQAQIEAFDDTWHWGLAAADAYDEVMKYHAGAAGILVALRSSLGENDMMAYLTMMCIRLVELHRVLKPEGSLYLHCDPVASHYLKMILDGIFSPICYRSEISWKRSSAHNDTKQGRKQYGNIRDVILFYTKSPNSWTWNTQYTEYDPSYVEKSYKHTEDVTGRRYGLYDLTGPGGAAKGNPEYEVMGVKRYWRFSEDKMKKLIADGRVVQTQPGTVPRQKRYLDEMPGVALQNSWDDIPPVSSHSKERIGYPTQKPLSLLERIVSGSSNPGDVVLDPFCGCGTAVHAAEKLKRHWVGIDVTFPAIQVINDRIQHYLPGTSYGVSGIPQTLEDAHALAHIDKYQFQFWAVSLVGGHSKYGKGADFGIDGQFFFKTDKRTDGRGIISVKGGKSVSVNMIRDLRGTIEREGAEIGVFICLAEPTQPMIREAASAGFFQSSQGKHPRLQIKTIGQLLSGQGIDSPLQYTTITMTNAGRRSSSTKQKRSVLDNSELLKQRTLLLPISGSKKAVAEPLRFAVSRLQQVA